MDTFSKQAEIALWDRDWRSIGAGYYVERVQDVHNQWQLYEVVKFHYLHGLFPRESGTSMLECGCGSAGVSLYFARRGYRCTMLDFAPTAIDVARQNFRIHGASGTFVLGDVEALPLRSNNYDIVTSFGLLEHFADPNLAIQEMVRVLKPGGLFFADIVPRRFCVQTIANYGFNLWAVLTYTLFSRHWQWGLAKMKFLLGMPEYYENSFSPKQYAEMMRTAGLEDVEIHGNNPFPRLYLPAILDRLYLRLLVSFLPIWQRFDSAHNYLTDVLWARAWWAHARKPCAPTETRCGRAG